MNVKKITPSLVKEAVLAEAIKIKRKKEIYATVKALNEELGLLETQGMIGAFGFANPGDASSKTTTGFADNFQTSMSNIARLEKEFADQDTKEQNLQEENDRLKKELSELKNKIEK